MGTEIRTWQIQDGKLKNINTSLSENDRTETKDLETWIESNTEILGEDIILIGRQVKTKSGFIDLLGIDRTGNLIIIELKRDKLPRECLAQAIDYASDASDWDKDNILEICLRYCNKSLEDIMADRFQDINLEDLIINDTQRILLVGFAIESSLERMINWLSENYNVNINAILLNYIKTNSGDELLTRTSIISEEVVQEKIKKKKFQFPMSDDPGTYDEKKLKTLLKKYLSQNLYSAKRIKDVLFPVCLKEGVITRDQLKDEFVKYGEADTTRDAGYFLSLISVQIGLKKNDFLRQVIKYEYPNNPWEKDNYRINEDYKELITGLLSELKEK